MASLKNKKMALDPLKVDDAIATNQNKNNLNIPIESSSLSKNTTMNNLESLSKVPISLSVVLGSTTMHLGKILKFHKGTVIELDQKIGEFVQIFVNNKLIAKGEIVVVDDKIAVNVIEIINK
ncbi:MAG: flagellar motor switch protein FliN [Rickettsia sp.]|nr:flagellar motor switch protein FliN [Rickettsia sp.]